MIFKTKFLILLTFNLIILLQHALGQTNLSNSNTIKIRVNFKGKGKINFNTYDDLFENKVISIGNPTRSDTVITQIIKATHPIHIYYSGNKFNPLTNRFIVQEKNFLLLPGDSIHLGFSYESQLYLIKNNRFNLILDSLFMVNGNNELNYKYGQFKIDDYTPEKTAKLLIQIDNNYIIIGKRIDSLFAFKQIDKKFKYYLDSFNLMVKYRNISLLHFDEKYPLDKVKQNFESHSRYITQNLEKLQSINSSYSFSYLYFLSRYDARLKSYPLKNFWDYFDFVNEPLKSNDFYRSYVLARLKSDETIFNIENYKNIIARAKQKGIYDSRFDSVLINKQKKQNLQNLKGKGLITTTNKPIDYFNLISSLKGKYILVDFWASWCGPCRAQMPSLQTVKSKLDRENIEFVSLSIDTENQHKDWIAASKDEKLDKEKHNYRLEKGYKNELLNIYNFSSVPRYLLYDKKGVLISDNFIAPNNVAFESELRKHLKTK